MVDSSVPIKMFIPTEVNQFNCIPCVPKKTTFYFGSLYLHYYQVFWGIWWQFWIALDLYFSIGTKIKKIEPKMTELEQET